MHDLTVLIDAVRGLGLDLYAHAPQVGDACREPHAAKLLQGLQRSDRAVLLHVSQYLLCLCHVYPPFREPLS